MSTEQLQRGFADLAGDVVPMDDPYGRLMRRAHRRRFGRIASALAAVLAMLGIGAAAALVAVLPTVGTRPDSRDPGHVVTSDWAWRLINSPARGNLADDDDFADRLDRYLSRRPNSALPQTRILFAEDVDGLQLAVVARYSATNAVVESVSTSNNFGNTTGEEQLRPAPTIVTGFGIVSGGPTLVLTPPGCGVSTSAPIAKPGVARVWSAPAGDWLLLPAGEAPVIRVGCEGTIRQQGPVAIVHEAAPRQVSTPDPAGYAVADFEQLTRALQLSPEPSVAWSGEVTLGGPSTMDNRETRTLVVVRGGRGAGQPLLCYLAGPEPNAWVAREFTKNLSRSDPVDRSPDFSLVSTAVTGGGAVELIRVPGRHEGRVGLTEDLLVLVPSGAVRVEASEAGAVVGRAGVVDGAAVVSVRMGSPTTVLAYGPDDAEVGLADLVEPARGERLFNELLITNW